MIHVVTIGKSTVRVLIKYEYSSTSTAVVAYSCTRVLVVGTFTGYRLPVTTGVGKWGGALRRYDGAYNPWEAYLVTP